MGARKQDILELERWFVDDDRQIEVLVKQSNNITAQVMTGWALTWELKTEQAGTVLITKSVGSGIVISSSAGTDDLATITIDKADTLASNVGAGKFYHSLRRTDSGSELVLMFGDVILLDN